MAAFEIDYFYRWNRRIVRTTDTLSGNGAISEIISSNLAPNSLLLSDASGKIVVSSLVSLSEAETLNGINLSYTIQEQFDLKQDLLTVGDVSESTSDVLVFAGNTGAIIGSGLSIQVRQSTAVQDGYLSSSDWSTFNAKQTSSLANGYVLIGNGTAQAVNLSSLGDISATVSGGLEIKSSVIDNTNIISTADITRTKLAPGTAYRILANDSSGEISENAALTPSMGVVITATGQLVASSATATQINYSNTLTGNIQTQLDNKIATQPVNTIVKSPTASEDGYAIVWDDAAQEYTLGDPVVQGIPTAGSTRQFLGKNTATNYDASWLSILADDISDFTGVADDLNILTGLDSLGLTSTDLEYVIGLTSNAQDQLDNKLNRTLAQHAIWVGNVSSVASPLSAGSNGDVLTISGGTPVWVAPGSGGTVTSIDVSGGTTGLTFSGGPITASGTITAAGTLDADNGGTGFSSYAVGDILYAATTTTFAKRSVGSNGDILTLSGGLPVWAAPVALSDGDKGDITVSSSGTVWTIDASINKTWTGTHSFRDNSFSLLDNADTSKILAFQLSGITTGTTRTLTAPDLSGTIALLGSSGNGAALTRVDDTNVTLTLGGAPNQSLLSATSITVGWSGQLAVTRGGTGLSSVSQGDILYSDASNSITVLAKSTSATRYLSNTGSSNNPSWSQVDLTNGVSGILPVANGGTGVSTGAWLLASGGAITGNNTISGNFAKYFTGTGTFVIGGNSGTAKFRVVGNNVSGTGELVRFDDNTPTNRFLLLENGATTITGASGVRPLTITATAEIGLRISNTGSFATINADGAQSILNGQTSSAGVTNSRGYFTNRIDGGIGGNIIGNIWNIVPNSNTTASTALVEEFSMKPGDGSSTVIGGNYRFIVFENTITPLMTTGFDWATFNNSGTGTLTTRMRLRGSQLAVGADFTPAATVDVLQSTLGDAAHKISSTATNDDPSVIVYQNRVATTDATVTTLHTITIPASTTVLLKATIVARRTGGVSGTAEDGASYNIIATFKNVAGTATQIGTTTVVSSHEDQSGWDATFDVTAATARVRVTGATNNNITWHLSKIEYMPVGS